MSSITDELIGELIGKTADGAKKTAEITTKAAKASKKAFTAVKGICLVLAAGSEFTTDTVMNAVRKSAFKKTGDIKFSENNIDIGELRKSGHVYQVEDNILQETMKYFDNQCKKYGIKYSAMKDTRNEGKTGSKPSYMVFFEGKDADLILHALKEAYKDYAEDQERAKESQKDGKENSKSGEKQNESKERNKGQKQQSREPEKRQSVKAKLAFFRDRAAAREQKRDVVEKHHQRSDIQR